MHASSGFAARQPAERRAWLHYLLCCFTVIVGVRWFLIQHYGAPIAWGDDLDGIGYRILGPWHLGTLTWSAFLTAHNGDHVITATRLWELFWYVLNGEWDPKAVMIVKVPIFAAAMTVFTHLLTRNLTRGRFVAAGILTVLFAFPFNAHNLLWAFQSQFDFFYLTAALGWLALLNDRPLLAMLFAALSPFTLGAGPVLAASYVPFFAWAGWTRRWSRAHAASLTVLAILIAALGASMSTGDGLPRTGGFFDRLATFVRLYAWPYSNLLSVFERLPETAKFLPARLVNFPSAEDSLVLRASALVKAYPVLLPIGHLAIATVLYAPVLALARRVVRRRGVSEAVMSIAWVAIFCGGLIAATAIARTEQVTIAIRFLDHLMLSSALAVVAAVLLVAADGRLRGWIAAWAVVAGLGYVATMGVTYQILARRSPQHSLQLLQRHYADSTRSVLRENANFNYFIVSSDPTEFLAMLEDPGLRAVLPREITAPGTGRGPVAAFTSLLGRSGLLFAFAGASAAAWVALRSRRRGVAGVILKPSPA